MVPNLSFVNLSGGWRKKKLWKFVIERLKLTPQSIGLSGDTELRGVRIFDHLTPKKQKLLFEAKKLKERDHYRFCLAKNSVIYLKNDEGSRAIKITDMDCLQRLAVET